MVFNIKQWESKYLRDFEAVRTGEVSEETLYRIMAAMYYDYVSKTNIEPFTITYGRGNGFCVNANSHVGVIVYDEVTLFINSMIPELSLGKILYLCSQAEEVSSAMDTKKVIVDNLNEEENIAAVDYFVVSLLQAVEEIHENGVLTEIKQTNITDNKIVGRLDIQRQVAKNPDYDMFHIIKSEPTKDIPVNRVIKKALLVSADMTALEWARPLLQNAAEYFFDAVVGDDISKEDFPQVGDVTSLAREDYEKALRFSKFILFGYDPLSGNSVSYFPEFFLDMNEVFEYYVNIGLKHIFKEGFENKKTFTLGVGPVDIPIGKKSIELDGYYEMNSRCVVVDTKNKYRMVLDKETSDFMATNPDIYQQYYYASRVNAGSIVLVYPSAKKHTVPIGEYQLNFVGNKNVKLYLWALQITSTPKENKRALINLAEFIENI